MRLIVACIRDRTCCDALLVAACSLLLVLSRSVRNLRTCIGDEPDLGQHLCHILTTSRSLRLKTCMSAVVRVFEGCLSSVAFVVYAYMRLKALRYYTSMHTCHASTLATQHVYAYMRAFAWKSMMHCNICFLISQVSQRPSESSKILFPHNGEKRFGGIGMEPVPYDRGN
jgi:hypothetical protein